MSLPNARIVVTGTVRTDVAVTAIEISNREAKRAGEVLEREASALSAKMKRELAALRSDLRKVR